MAFFKKNPNESTYAGGKKHWIDVIKNTGPENFLIWRQPEEDFNTNSKLIVMPGEEAIFIKGGTVEQTFENGTYNLSTENYPFISRLRNAFSGGISTFNCVVYFVRKTHSIEIKWGTDTPIQVRDKVYGILTNAKVRGAYKIQIGNPVIFLEKMIGSRTALEGQDLSKYFASEFQGKIKSAVSKFLNSLPQELIGIDAYMDELSDGITPAIDEILQPYGLECVKFSLAAIDIDISKYNRIDEFQIEAAKKMKLAQGDAAAFEILGDNWAKLQSADILKTLAQNPGAGGMAAAGAGLGMGMATAGVFNSMAQEMSKPVSQNTQAQAAQPSGGFVQQSQPAEQSDEKEQEKEDPIETLSRLKKMFDLGLIEKSEYDAKKLEVLSKM